MNGGLIRVELILYIEPLRDMERYTTYLGAGRSFNARELNELLQSEYQHEFKVTGVEII